MGQWRVGHKELVTCLPCVWYLKSVDAHVRGQSPGQRENVHVCVCGGEHGCRSMPCMWCVYNNKSNHSNKKSNNNHVIIVLVFATFFCITNCTWHSIFTMTTLNVQSWIVSSVENCKDYLFTTKKKGRRDLCIVSKKRFWRQVTHFSRGSFYCLWYFCTCTIESIFRSQI